MWGGSKPGRRVVFSEDALKAILCSTSEKTPAIGGSNSKARTASIKSPLEQLIKDERARLKGISRTSYGEQNT